MKLAPTLLKARSERVLGNPPSSLYEVNRILLVDDISYTPGVVTDPSDPASYHPCPALPGSAPITDRKY